MMQQLRQDLLSTPCDRDRCIKLLSELYSASASYPSHPPLNGFEVVKTKAVPSGAGAFGECYEGLFLGRHKVAMKCCHISVPNHVETRDSEPDERWKSGKG